MLEYIAFLSCLQFAVLNSIYCCTVLKPRQVICLESIYLKKDVLCVLPTGYGKSLVFHLLPGLLFAKEKLDDVLDDWKSKGIAGVTTIVVVVSPLNALMSNQIARLNLSGIRASVLNVKEATEMKDAAVSFDDDGSVVDVFNCDFRLCEEHKLRLGYYHIVFSHPESFISTRYGRMLLQSKPYQDNICAIVIDEAHCILEWGNDFRKDYNKLGVLCAIFPDVPVLAMTATANHLDRKGIKESLGLKNCKNIIGNPDRKNIVYKKYLRHGHDIDSIQNILNPIAQNLLKDQICYPITVVYISLRWCGFAYKLFEFVLGKKQYYPEGEPEVPENRLFAQFHASQTKQMKEEILHQMCSTKSTVRVVFATVAMGMGVDISSIRNIIHIGPPCTIKGYFQETGRAGRDGKPALALLYYNNRDIAQNRTAMQDDMRSFCSSENICLRYLLLKSLDYDQTEPIYPLHTCCNVCEKQCQCQQCYKSGTLLH